jgi:hypothetical protein
MKRTAAGGILAPLSLLLCCVASADDTVVLGPLEGVSSARSEVTVLGQKVRITSSTHLSGVPPTGVAIGEQQLLVVARSDSAGKLVATDLKVSDSRYFPGATPVIIQGRIDAVANARAEFLINGLTVYFGDIASLPSKQFLAGEHVVVTGVQALPGGALWASSVRNDGAVRSPDGTASLIQSITGTGAFSVSAAELQSITGTGKRSITGTGKLSITGTGIQSITGTGIQSITGTGALSITGTGALSITGTGINSITGTGALSITGTGLNSITGTGTNSITGTGRQSIPSTNSITGTGISAAL